MKRILLPFLSIFFAIQSYGYQVSGMATNSETGAPLSGFDILLTYPTGGIASSTTTGTDDQGEFTFVNFPPGTNASISVTSQDTDYWNCGGSVITGFTVPEEGLQDVDLYQ